MSMLDWFTLTASLTSLCLLCFIIGVVAGKRDDPHRPKPKNLNKVRDEAWSIGYDCGYEVGLKNGEAIGYDSGWTAAKNFYDKNNQKL